MKKILLLIRTLEYGGAERSLVSFLNTIDRRYLQENDIQLDLLLTLRGGFFENQIPDFVNLIHCPEDYAAYCNPISILFKRKCKSLVLSGLPRKIYSVIVKKMVRGSGLAAGELQWKYVGKTLKKLPQRYDVAMAYFHDASAYYLMDKVDADKKIIWIHNQYDKLGFNDNFEKEMYSRADKLVTISDRCVESLIKHFPELKDKVEMVENISSSVIIHRMAKEHPTPEYIDDQINILSVGRLCDQKGYDIGLKALSMLNNTKTKYHWYIMGAGEKESELRLMIDQLGLKDKVSLIGLRSNPYPYIGNCDVFFQPSRYEGKSIALDEAMILHRPIVATAYDTVTDSITNGVNGIICGFDPAEIAKELQVIIDDNHLRDRLICHLHSEKHGNEEEIDKYYSLIC